MTTYDPHRRTIRDLLNADHPIRVPDYQRDYSWKPKEFQTFWYDLENFCSGTEIQPSNNQYFLGSIVLITCKNHYLLLDGQQRLATACILLSCIRDTLEEFAPTDADEIQNTFLRRKEPFGGSKETDRLTLNEADRSFFKRDVIERRKPGLKKPKPSRRSEMFIRSAKIFFTIKLGEQTDPAKKAYSIARLRALGSALTNNFSTIAVYASDEDNAAQIFETLNDRGIGLSPADLLQNLILKSAPKEKRKDTKSMWTQMGGKLGDTRPEEFLRYFWISREGNVKSQSLYRAMKNSLQSSGKDGYQFMSELINEVETFINISRGKHKDPEIGQMYLDMWNLSEPSLIPFALNANRINVKQQKRLLNSILTLYVRHVIVCQDDKNDFENKVYDAARKIRSKNVKDIDHVIAVFFEACPIDKKFKANFEELEIKNRNLQRYLLSKLELAKRPKGELTIAKEITIEHIYPQKPSFGKWSKHNKLINRLGNLTLLSRALNSKIKNGPINKKISEYQKSSIRLTNELTKFERWGPRSVESRQRKLAALAVKAWPRVK